MGVRQCDELWLVIYEGSPVSFTVMEKNDKLVTACFAFWTLSFSLLLLCLFQPFQSGRAAWCMGSTSPSQQGAVLLEVISDVGANVYAKLIKEHTVSSL